MVEWKIVFNCFFRLFSVFDHFFHFLRYGEVTDVFIPTPFRAFAFVQFEEAHVAQNLCNEDHLIQGVSVYTSTADPKSQLNAAQSGNSIGANVPSRTKSFEFSNLKNGIS